MRTTLDIEDDVLQAAKEIAVQERSTAGVVLSRLARQGLRTVCASPTGSSIKNGVPVFSARAGEVVTMERIQQLAEEQGI